MNETPPTPVQVRLDDTVIGTLEPVMAHGARHWRFVLPNDYHGVDRADGVDGHIRMFEVYRCPPGCPKHPPVVVCGEDRETWPCGPVQAVCAELDDLAGVMRLKAPIDGEVWQKCADLLANRARALATAGGALQ